MTTFPTVDRWLIPRDAWRESFEEMARDGRAGNEGVALWLGQSRDGVATVSHVVVLRGPGIVKQPALLMISSALINDITDIAIELGAVLIGQIHAHGPGWSIDLSHTDRTCGIAHPSYLSVVAPDYGLRPQVGPDQCGVHVYMPRIGFTRLSSADTRRRVTLVDGPVARPLVVGGLT